MKKLFFFFLLSVFASGVFSQTQKYHRVRVETGKDGLAKLALAGVAVDHGEYKKGASFIGEFSDTELELIRQSGLTYDLLITDLSSYYVNRNKNTQRSSALAGACNDCKDYKPVTNFTLGSMGGFYTLAEMLVVLDSMAAKFPNLITVQQQIDTAKTFEGRSVYYVKISDNPSVNENEPEVLYTALHHAREPESLSQLIYYMWYLLENYGTNAEVTSLVNNLEMYFVPCLNPDGYVYNQTTNPGGGGMWRKNRRNNGDGTYGVDLNRNYGYNWGYDDFGSSPNTNSDTYRGTAAFSEAETQMIMRFCNNHVFDLALNNHTYGNVLVQPFGYSATAYTPDSLAFIDFGMKLTYCDAFSYGSAMQTVGYNANGVSDDWMYGEQGTKPKIYSMTPEAGSTDDGFWPAQVDIIPIAQRTLDQNINLARLASVYADVKDANSPFIQKNGFVKYDIKRLGLQAGSFTVSVTGIGPNFSLVGTPNVHAGMSLLQSKTDSISCDLVSGIAPGTAVKYILSVSNGSYSLSDTITRLYGYPTTVFSDNCSAITQWTGTWNTSGAYYVSSNKSITDSPSGDYPSGANTITTTASNINLTGAIGAYLEYYARWELEKNWDYVEIQVSTNGITFSPLCALYTHGGNSSQNNGDPLYDGFQRYWIKEKINLSAYLGQNIKLRFNLISDNGVEYDGFYFDDVTVKVIYPNSTSVGSITSAGDRINIYPVPANDVVYVILSEVADISLNISIFNLLGEEVLVKQYTGGQSKYELNTHLLTPGTYFVRVNSNGKTCAQKLIISR